MRGSAQPISRLLEGLLAQAQKQQRGLFLVQEAWTKIAGKALAAHTRPVSLRKGKLVIHVDRPGENYLFKFERERVLKRVEKLTEGKATEIVVRAGKVA